MGGFKDIGKKANDLFDVSEYALNQEFEVSGAEDNVNFNATTTLEGDSVTTAVEYNQGQIQVTADTNGNQTVSYDKIKLPADMSGKVTYARGSGDTVEAKVKCGTYGIELKAKTDLNFNVKTDFSYVFSKDAAQVGLKIPVDFTKGFDANKIGFAAQYTSGANTFALTSASILNQQASLSFFRSQSADLNLGFQFNYQPGKDTAQGVNVGATYKINDKSGFQAFANGSGTLRAKYSYTLSKFLTASAQFETSINSPLNVRRGFRVVFN